MVADTGGKTVGSARLWLVPTCLGERDFIGHLFITCCCLLGRVEDVVRNVYRPVNIFPTLVTPGPCSDQQFFSVNLRKDETPRMIGLAGLDKVVKYAAQIFRIGRATFYLAGLL
jgi:hypothetical protein